MGALAGCGDSDDSVHPAPEEAGTTPDGARHHPGGRDASKPDAIVVGDAAHLFPGPDSGPSVDAAVVVLPVGDHCKTDADCAAGLTCVKSTDTIQGTDGGPAGGFCTKECTPEAEDAGALVAAAAVCTAINPLGKCVRFDRNSLKAYCFMTCLPGPYPQAFKCEGRPDQACALLGSGGGYCAPTCSTDAECTGGRTCDLSTGYCSAPKSGGAPMGTPCGTGSALETSGGHCEGGCFGFLTSSVDPPAYLCSGQCVLGQLGCGTSVTDAGTGIAGPGVCAIPQTPSSRSGDIGFCAPSCACDSDCGSASMVCAKVLTRPIPGLKDGACVPTVLFDTPIPGTPCGDAGKDAGPPRRDAGDAGPKKTDAGDARAD